VFQPWKFQKSIDTNAAGGLNYESCNSIRTDVLRMIICVFGLDKYAATGSGHRPVMIAHTLDGAMLTSHLGHHVTAAIKIVDPRACDPVSGIPIGIAGLFQSRELCFPIQIVFGKDCKNLYTYCFGLFHGKFNGGLVMPPAIDGCPELSNFQVISPQDMSSIWKTTGLGQGCYNKKQFCYCCMCTNEFISVCKKTGDSRCDLCCKFEIDRCFCHPVNDSVHLHQLSAMLELHVQAALDDGFSKLDYIAAKSKLNTNPQTANKHNNPNHIDFVPASDAEVTSFNNLLKDELKLRLSSRADLSAFISTTLSICKVYGSVG
jgi:hypothetical protein